MGWKKKCVFVKNINVYVWERVRSIYVGSCEWLGKEKKNWEEREREEKKESFTLNFPAILSYYYALETSTPWRCVTCKSAPPFSQAKPQRCHPPRAHQYCTHRSYVYIYASGTSGWFFRSRILLALYVI